jgi:predicted GIY-YIG superfamily endonuclease
MVWRVYLLECVASTGRVTLHVGIAKDVFARAVQHANGWVKQTRGRQVYLLAYSTPMTHAQALRRERQVRRMRTAEKRGLVDRWRKAEGDPRVSLALHHLTAAKQALQRARACFPVDHPTADDELALAHQGIADARRWLAKA